MKSMIKGLKVTINVSVKADEIATTNYRHDENRERRDEEAYKGIDINVGADIELAESDGEVDLGEISDILHISLKDQVKEQIKECLDERRSNPARTPDEEVRHATGE